MRTVRIAILTLAGLVAGAQLVQAQQDVNISGQNVYQVLARGAAWGSSNAPNTPGLGGGVNNTFLFQAVNPNTQVCLYIRNNNPTSAHSVTVKMWQSGDPAVKIFTSDQSAWNQASSLQAASVSIPHTSTSVWYFNVSAGAMLAAQITASTSQAGSPDTADIIADQTTSGQCGVAASLLGAVQGGDASGSTMVTNPFTIAGLNSSGTTTVTRFKTGFNGGFPLSELSSVNLRTGQPNLSGAPIPLGDNLGHLVFPVFALDPCGDLATCPGGFSDDPLVLNNFNSGLSTSYVVSSGSLTNPAVNTDVLSLYHINTDSTRAQLRDLYLDCSASCHLQVFRITAAGSTCTTLAPTNTEMTQTRAAHLEAVTSCTTHPTLGALLYDLTLAAATPYTLNLKGFTVAIPASGAAGIDVVVATALTGTTSATANWGEQ